MSEVLTTAQKLTRERDDVEYGAREFMNNTAVGSFETGRDFVNALLAPIVYFLCP